MGINKLAEDFFQILATALDYQCIFKASHYPYLKQFYFNCKGKTKFDYESISSAVTSTLYNWEEISLFFEEVPKSKYNPDIAINFILFLMENNISFNILSNADILEITIGHADKIEISDKEIFIKEKNMIGVDKIESYISYYKDEF